MISKTLAALAAGTALAITFGQASVAAPAPATAAAKGWAIPSDAEIRKVLSDRIDVRHQNVGIVVGLIDAQGHKRVISYGALDKGDTRPLNGDTVFEIGSITKVFTSLLLSDMVQRGEVKLDDPVAKYLPATVTIPQRGGKQITLVDLATQSSGLPRMPGNFAPKDMTNPYADYSVEQMYQFLSGYQLTRDIGSKYDYSNLGVGLLGHALTLRAGEDYDTLVKQRIAGPLGMTSTGVAVTPSMKARFAVGHDEALNPVPYWDLPTLAGAGALRSSVNDMLIFLSAELGDIQTPLNGAMKAQLEPRRPTGRPGLEIALAWHILDTPAGQTIWHNGGTGGFRTFLGFDPKRHVAIVVLGNASSEAGVDDIAMHVLNGTPLSAPPAPRVEHKAIHLDAAALDIYVGRYQLAPNVFLDVTRTDDHLFAQLTGQGANEIFPEAPGKFFWKGIDVQATFQMGADGRPTGLVARQNGQDMAAKRVP